jgi:hypothetical protein
MRAHLRNARLYVEEQLAAEAAAGQAAAARPARPAARVGTLTKAVGTKAAGARRR